MTKESTYLPTIRLWTRDRLVLYMALATSLESNEIKLYVASSLLKLGGHLACMDSILIVSQTRHKRSSVKKKSVYSKITLLKTIKLPISQCKLPCCWLSCCSGSSVIHKRNHWSAWIKTWKNCLKQKEKSGMLGAATSATTEIRDDLHFINPSSSR